MTITLSSLWATHRERLLELFCGIISTSIASSGTSEYSHCKQSKSTHQDTQLLTFIMENYSQQKCHFSSVQFLVIINIFISLLSFSYTCGVLDHTDFFTCAKLFLERGQSSTSWNTEQNSQGPSPDFQKEVLRISYSTFSDFFSTS